LNYLHGTQHLPFRKIALLGEFEGIPAGTLCAIAKGEKVPDKWRRRLGLTLTATVYVIGGSVIPPGAQVISASLCECGQPYISNHPARKKCFICSPFRKRNK
jgi:hypothetical protein